MKKTLLAILSLLFCLSALFACGESEGGSGGNGKPTAGAIYGEGMTTYLVSDVQYNDLEYSYVSDLYSALLIRNDGDTIFVPGSVEKVDNEIVVGSTSRDISKKAEEYLAKRIKREARKSTDEDYAIEDLVGYAIYSDGSSVAIVWTDYHIASVALEYFTKNYIEISDSLALEDGYVKSSVFSLDGYLTERGNKIINDAWAKYETYAGADITNAMKELYTLYTEEMVLWYADLYDPEIGGWYWSNSARDNEGFLPSIEETYEALNFISNSGMAEMYGGKWENAIPQWLKEDVANFIYNLQDPDGFYYHPQWPKEFINAGGLQSRITRDKGSANHILSKLGVKPKYSSYSSKDSLTDKLGDSSVVAVSKVIAVADKEMLWQYESVENFEAFLNDYRAQLSRTTSWATLFYSWGNQFQSTTGYMNQEMKDMLIEFFYEYQDPESGMWMHPSEDLEEAYPTNGLHKVGAVFNYIGGELRYTDQMVSTVFEMLSWTIDEKPQGGCTGIYNTWSCLPYIYTNIRNFSQGTDIERIERCQKIKNRVYAEAPRLINITFEQVSGFRLPDGSFTLVRGAGSHYGQGCQIAVPGVLEGNVNGTSIAHFALINHIDQALELQQYSVPTFTERERVMFINRLEEMNPVIKAEAELATEVVYDFTEIEEGTLPEEFTSALDAGRVPNEGSKISVEKLDDGNNVLYVHARPKTVNNGRNYSINIPVLDTNRNSNASIIEHKLYIDRSSSVMPSLIEVIYRAQKGANIVLYLKVGLNAAGVVSLYDSNSAKICDIGKANEVIDLKIEYYPTDGVYKVFSGSVFKGAATSTYAGAAHAIIGSVSMSTPSGGHGEYWFDDVNFRSTLKEYVDPSEDMSAVQPATYEDFEGDYDEFEKALSYDDAGTLVAGSVSNIAFDSGIAVEYGGYTNKHGATASVMTDTAGNKYVNITSPTRVHARDRSHGITLAPEQCTFSPNAYAFDLDLKVDSKLSDNTKSCGIVSIVAYGTNKKYTQYNANLDAQGNIYFGGVKAGSVDEWCSLRFLFNVSTEFIELYAKNSDGEYEFLGKLGNATDASGKNTSDISVIGDQLATVAISCNSPVSFNVDNIAFYSTKVAESETPDEPTAPKPTEPRTETFDGRIETTFDGIVEGISCPSTGLATEFDSTSHSNTTGETGAWVIDDGTGNKVLNLYSPGRIGSPLDRPVTLPVKVMDKLVSNPNAYVFKFDITFRDELKGNHATTVASAPLELLVRDENNQYNQFQIETNAQKRLTIRGKEGSAVIGNWNEKISFTFIVYGGELRVYVSNTLIAKYSEGASSSLSFGQMHGISKIQICPFNSGGQIDILIDNVCAYTAELNASDMKAETVSPID